MKGYDTDNNLNAPSAGGFEMTTTHDLKSWPEFFQVSFEGNKPFELRKNDRDFKIGDTVVLWEYLPDTDTMTGRTLVCKITYVLTSGPWLTPGYCALGLTTEIDAARIDRARAEGYPRGAKETKERILIAIKMAGGMAEQFGNQVKAETVAHIYALVEALPIDTKADQPQAADVAEVAACGKEGEGEDYEQH